MWMHTHDTLAKRLGLILTRLNMGERLVLETLSQDYGVSTRTLHRDLNERLGYLPIQRTGSTYYLNPRYLGRSSKSDIKPVLDMLGLSKIFPAYDALSFSRLSNTEVPPFLFRDMKVEDVSNYQSTFKSLTLAIQNLQVTSFTYKQQQYQKVSPYRLVNDRGWWYLAAVHNDTLKSFKVANISETIVTQLNFKRSKDIDSQIAESAMLWLTDKPIEVVLKIDSAIASHFSNTPLLPEQQLLKVLDDDSLLVTSTITDKKQIIPILKYWLPDIEILSPTELKQSLVYELQFSIDRLSM
ncbi:MAG: WYL domain-containing protein [Methylococcales bacterium]